MRESFPKPADLNLQPLRIPSGWTIGWNTLYASSRVENGDFGGSSVFNATHTPLRFNIDVEFRPEYDPGGEFQLVVLYQPWPRDKRGRRRGDLPLSFDGDAETVHTFVTTSYAEMIHQLEQCMAHCSSWTRELN